MYPVSIPCGILHDMIQLKFEIISLLAYDKLVKTRLDVIAFIHI